MLKRRCKHSLLEIMFTRILTHLERKRSEVKDFPKTKGG